MLISPITNQSVFNQITQTVYTAHNNGVNGIVKQTSHTAKTNYRYSYHHIFCFTSQFHWIPFSLANQSLLPTVSFPPFWLLQHKFYCRYFTAIPDA